MSDNERITTLENFPNVEFNYSDKQRIYAEDFDYIGEALTANNNNIADLYSANYVQVGNSELTIPGDVISASFGGGEGILRFRMIAFPTGGNINATLTLNNDTGANYSGRTTTSGDIYASVTSQNFILATPGSSDNFFIVDGIIYDVESSEKLVYIRSMGRGGVGAGNIPGLRENYAKWANTANYVTSLQLTNGAAGDFAAGTKLYVGRSPF